MRLNKKIQYGMVFALYLARAGRSTVEGAAESLGLSVSFLEQVARKLRIAGVVKSVRGPNGGYELEGHPTVSEIFEALAPVRLFTNQEANGYVTGNAEQRAFMLWASKLSLSLCPPMNMYVKELNTNLVTNELAALERAVETATVN